MASESVRAVLNEIWEALDPLNVPSALIGGLALAVWSYPRATRDVDLLVGVDAAHSEPVINSLLAIGCRSKKTPPVFRVGEQSFIQLLYAPPGGFYDVQIYLLLAVSDFQKTALARSVSRSVTGVERPIHVLNCDDLILFKLIAGRMIDLADAAMLLRENREAVDPVYLTSWVGRLKVTADYQRIWQDAFPDEPLLDATDFA